MTRKKNPVSDAELEVLKALWDHGPGTVRDVQSRMNADGRDRAYTTAQTLLVRLQGKGYVTSAKEGRAYVFRAAVSRDDLVGRSLEALADRVCDGASLPLLLNLVQSSRFAAGDIARFRELLDELEGDSGTGGDA